MTRVFRLAALFGLSALLAVLVSFWAGPGVATANYGSGVTCSVPPPYPNTCWSELRDRENRTVYGIWAQFNDQYISVGDSTHTNNSLWLTASDGTLLELGVCAGPAGSTCQACRGCTYDQFVAINGAIVWNRSVASDGSRNTYYIMSSGWDGHGYPWHFYIDQGSGPVKVYELDLSLRMGNSNSALTGGEFAAATQYGITANDSTGGFSNLVHLEYTDTSWHLWTSYDTGPFGIWQPCYSLGWTPPNCMNGQIPQQSVWNWNIPG
jgi:hypothetical protein